MALFGFNYNKPGPGVSKDEPEKKAFFRFFSVYGAKFWDLIKMNMLYIITVIIQWVPMIIFLVTFFSQKDLSAQLSNLYNYMIMLVCALPLALTGPFTCGYAYLLRNCVRREHYFMISDYNDTLKSNFRQSFIATLINVMVFIVLLFNLRFYYIQLNTNQLFVLPLALCVFLMLMLIFMSYYIYVMMITFKLTLKQLYKNSFIFAVLGIGRNILVTILLAAIIFLHALFYPISLFFVPFFSLSFIGLIISFSSWPMLKKYMIDPQTVEEKPDENAEDGPQVFDDRGRER
jgi:uncharacterized membrane protein YesL